MKKIAIIGGGVCGLSAGIFARLNGFKSTIIEKNSSVGGECTGWDRDGYHIDGCIHWLVGTKKGTPLNKLWEITGALEEIEIYHPESFMVVEHEGVTVNFYRDVERLKESWLEISLQDKVMIEQFCLDIKMLQSFEVPAGKPRDMMNIFDTIKYFMKMKDAAAVLQKYSKISVNELAEKFKHPALREAVASFMPDGKYCAYSVLFPLGTFTGGQSSLPVGGSRALSERMAKKYLSLGGKIVTSCEVTELEIKDNMVSRLLCGNGKTFDADYFIAACDAHFFYETLLNGNYPDREFKKRYDDSYTYPLASNIYIGIGYEGIMNDVPRTLRFPVCSVDIKQDKKAVTHLQMTHYGYEPSFAPEGHTVVTFAINQFKPEIEMWMTLGNNREAYKKEKQRIGEEVIKAMTGRFPHMSGKLKLLDVATPFTYKRYCNAYQGAFMGFLPTVGSKYLDHPGYVRGLDNILLSGQWLQPPGGLPVAVITGKDAIMRIAKKEKQRFVDQ